MSSSAYVIGALWLAALLAGCAGHAVWDAQGQPLNWVRVETDALSFSLPNPSALKRIDSDDSDIVEWGGDGYRVKYERILTRRVDWNDTACSRYSKSVDAMICPGESGTFVLADDPLGAGMHEILINTIRFDLERHMVRKVLETWRPVNRWDALVLLGVDPERGLAWLQNEVGSIRLARIGDIVTRDYGSISEINRDGILIHELLPDGMGGFSKTPRLVLIRN